MVAHASETGSATPHFVCDVVRRCRIALKRVVPTRLGLGIVKLEKDKLEKGETVQKKSEKPRC